MTVRQASTVADLLMSKTKSGFLITFTQNRRGTLEEGGGEGLLVKRFLTRKVYIFTGTGSIKIYHAITKLREAKSTCSTIVLGAWSFRYCTCVPVGLPCVEGLWVLYPELGSLQVQKVKQALDGLGQGAPVGHRKHGVEESVHIRLEDTLQGEGRGGRGRE